MFPHPIAQVAGGIETMISFAWLGRGNKTKWMQALSRAISGGLFSVVVAMMLLIWHAPQAQAQTAVSGAIASNTHWIAAENPYVLSGDVIVQNGAILTIDAGVTVYMGQNAKLTVQAGSIQAAGTASDIISVLSEKTQLGQTASPGDWDQWVFNAGTVNTQLDHVLFEHGKGIAVNGSAPIFNYLNLRNHLGAAITIDLSASPTGVGNQASGNTLNGTAVPAGDITGTVKWGLRGIPYIVASGVVSVGVAPTLTALSPKYVAFGETATITATGTRLTGAEAPRFPSTNLSATIGTGGTATSFPFTLTIPANATEGNYDFAVMTAAGPVKLPGALQVLAQRPKLLSLVPDKVYAGSGRSVVATGTGFRPETIAQVNGVAAPTVYQNASALQVSLPTLTVGNAAISLRTQLANGDILTDGPVTLPVLASVLTLAPSAPRVVAGQTVQATVSVPLAIGADLIITPASSPTGKLALPASLTLPQGQTGITLPIQSTSTTSWSDETVQLTLNAPGFTALSSNVVVEALPQLRLSLSTNAVLGTRAEVSRPRTVLVESNKPAGTGGFTVSFTSSAPAILPAPAPVVIAAGQLQATTTITPTQTGTAELRASGVGFPDAALNVVAVTQTPPNLIIVPQPVAVKPGANGSFTIRLDRLDSIDHTITLAIANTALATLSTTTLTIPAGSLETSFTIHGVATGTTTITISSEPLAAVTTTVFVSTDVASLGSGYSADVGVLVGQYADSPITAGDTFFSTDVGVLVGQYADSPIATGDVFVSGDLGVQVGPIVP